MTDTKNVKPQKIAKDDYALLADAVTAHGDQIKTAAGPKLSDAQIVQLGRLLALKNKCIALRDAPAKTYKRKTTAGK